MMYGWHDGGWGWGQWVVMIILMVVFWSAIVAVAMMFVRHFRGGYTGAPPGPPAPPGPGAPYERGPEAALHVLEERFARGDIDADEFTRRRDLLLRR